MYSLSGRYNKILVHLTLAGLLGSVFSVGCSGSAEDSANSDGSIDIGTSMCDPEPLPTPVGLLVAVNGSPSGDGSAAKPLDLATALSRQSPANKAGGRILIKGGTYEGRYQSELTGTETQPIIVRAMPGERVTLDGCGKNIDPYLTNPAMGTPPNTLEVRGAYTQFIGIEVTCGRSDGKLGRISLKSGSNPDDLINRGGVSVYGQSIKISDFIVHDGSGGVDLWKTATGSELYGTIIYNQGWQGPAGDRGHGHSVYTQNGTGTLRYEHNVFFFGYSFGMHAYTAGMAPIQGFDLIENVWFRSGASAVGGESAIEDGFLIGGESVKDPMGNEQGSPAGRTQLIGNLSWAPNPDARGIGLGWAKAITNKEILLQANYLTGQVRFNAPWTSVTLDNNTIYGNLTGSVPGAFPNNVISQNRPSGAKVFIRKDKYDSSRALIAIFNWDSLDAIDVDLSEVLSGRGQYKIHSVMDLFGSAVTEGVYTGSGKIRIPMGTRPAIAPIGASTNIEPSDDPKKDFGVFVLHFSRCH